MSTIRKEKAFSGRVWPPRRQYIGQLTWHWKWKHRPNFRRCPSTWYADCGRCKTSASSAVRVWPVYPWKLFKKTSQARVANRNPCHHIPGVRADASFAGSDPFQWRSVIVVVADSKWWGSDGVIVAAFKSPSWVVNVRQKRRGGPSTCRLVAVCNGVAMTFLIRSSWSSYHVLRQR